jgi:CheY-like chemotaxis protein
MANYLAEGASNSAQTTRVIIVDDLADAADSLALLLRRLGYEVRAVYDGASALSVAAEFAPHAILLDLALPKLDGLQVAVQLRQNMALQNVCLIALSGYGQADDRERTRRAGFDFHLLKPVNFDELRRLLEALPR